MESEKDTEKYLVEQVESIGGLCRKFTSAGVRGVPDRVCLFPRGITIWVETKSEGDKPTDGQLREHARMLDRKHRVWVIKTTYEVDEMIWEVNCELLRRF